MNKVIGKVIVKETGIGIPNMLAIIYDMDPKTKPEECLGSGQPALGADFWQRFQADRIGSVITDDKGEFSLSYEDSEFQVRNQEKRPDLVLLVMAPEEPASETDSNVIPPEKRILHYSYVPRANAGRTESYLIQLPKERLDMFGISFGKPERMELDPDTYIASVAKSLKNREVIRKNLPPVIKKEVDHQTLIMKNAKKFVAKLGAVPLAKRKSPLFVETADGLASALEGTMAASLKRLADYKGGLTLRLSKEELTILGLEEVNGEILGPNEIDHEKLMQVMEKRAERGETVVLERARTLIEGCWDVRATSAALDSLDGPSSPSDSGTPPAGGLPATLQESILASVKEQVDDIEPINFNDLLKRPNNTDIGINISKNELSGGPADVTSYHDFHTLQIAFQDVWTSAFDGLLKSDVESFYGEVVRVREELGLSTADLEALGDVNDLRRLLSDLGATGVTYDVVPIPSDVAELFPEISLDLWNSLGVDQHRIISSAVWHIKHDEHEAYYREQVQKLLANPSGVRSRVQKLLLSIGQRLSEKHAFDIFVPDSYNFGIMTTYRQKWEPITYQTGNLVATIPLAPGENRKFTTKQVVKKSRQQIETEKGLSSRSLESSETLRAESEILRKASLSTNFKMASEGSFNIGIGSISGSNEFSMNQAEETAETKKAFRESVRKAASEYKNERSLEVNTSDSSEVEHTSSGEISNPNQEITVTYLFYELQRRYRINEFIQRVTPVIMVAQDVPYPHEIDEAWLISYEWTLRRVLLDDSLQPALDELTNSFAGDELGLSIIKANWDTQNRIAKQLEATAGGLLSTRDKIREGLINTEQSHAIAAAREEAEGWFSDAIGDLFTGDAGEMARDELDARVKSLQKKLDYVEETLLQTQEKLLIARESLDSATGKYTDSIKTQTNRRVAIDQLRIHIKDNILYYIQAIWSHEVPDQRYFRLYDNEIEVPASPVSGKCIRKKAAAIWIPEPPGGKSTKKLPVEFECIPPSMTETKKLVEIADLDHPLGFKGNYIIFPLKKSNYLTSYMMREYYDDYFGASDPVWMNDYTVEDLLEFAECAWNRPGITDVEKNQIRDAVMQRLSSPRRNADEIIIPTGQLFIEALPGAHPLIEDFKLKHRKMDVLKVEAEIRSAELENLRKAARLEEGELGDPDIEKKIVVEGDGTDVIVPPDA